MPADSSGGTGGEATLLPQGGGAPSLPNFGGSFLFMRTPFVAKVPNLTLFGGGAYILESATPPIPRQRIVNVKYLTYDAYIELGYAQFQYSQQHK